MVGLEVDPTPRYKPVKPAPVGKPTPIGKPIPKGHPTPIDNDPTPIDNKPTPKNDPTPKHDPTPKGLGRPQRQSSKSLIHIETFKRSP